MKQVVGCDGSMTPSNSGILGGNVSNVRVITDIA